jgi:hypothetical protein
MKPLIARRSARRAVAALLLVVTGAAGCTSGASPTATPSTRPPGTGGQPATGGPSGGPVVTPPASGTPRAVPVSVAIFGDSQASALYATRPSSVAQFLTLSDESISACGILGGRVVSRSGESFDLTGACPYWLDHWRSGARSARADIALVVIGAWDVFDVEKGSTTLPFGSPAWDANFLATLRSGLAAIRASISQVALAELPCYRPRPTNPRPPGYWPERGDDTRTRHVNDLLRQAADGVHIFTVTPPSAFCDDPSIGDNRQYRYDGVHYLPPGAKLYFDAVIPQLLRLPA